MGYQVNLLARLLAQALQQRTAKHGVVPGQFAQLLALYDRDGQTASELCRAVRIEAPTMTATLRRMERDGLIRRVPDPHDGRQVRIHLTKRARTLEPTMRGIVQAGNAGVLQELSDREVTQFMRTLARLINRLETTLGPATARGRQ